MIDRKALVIGVEVDGRHVLALTVRPVTMAIDVSRFIQYGPYREIAEVDAAILSIEAQADDDDAMEIQCKDTLGHSHLFRVDAGQHLLLAR